MRIAMTIAGLVLCLTSECGPARADGNREIFPSPAPSQRAEIANKSEGMLAKRAQNIPRNIPASEMTASDATALLCPGRGSLAPIFQAAAERYRIRPAVLVAMVRVESSCNPRAVNRRTGSYGLLQIKLDGSANVEDLSAAALLEPEANISAAARHLRRWTLACGSLAGGLAIFHGKKTCRDGRTDGYARRVLDLVGWAKRTIAKLQKVRS